MKLSANMVQIKGGDAVRQPLTAPPSEQSYYSNLTYRLCAENVYLSFFT